MVFFFVHFCNVYVLLLESGQLLRSNSIPLVLLHVPIRLILLPTHMVQFLHKMPSNLAAHLLIQSHIGFPGLVLDVLNVLH